MTRIDVHFNIEAAGKLVYCCRLIRKIYRSGQKVVVYDNRPSALAQLDQLLWSFSALDFIPHVMADHELAADTPVLLTGRDADPPHHSVLVNLGDEAPTFFSRFERLVDLVGNADDDVKAGRRRWRFYTDRGYPTTRHDAAARASEHPPTAH